MRANESDTKEEEEKKRNRKQEPGDVSYMEKPSVLQIREALNSLFNFALITGNKEIKHIAIKTSKTAEKKLT